MVLTLMVIIKYIWKNILKSYIQKVTYFRRIGLLYR